MCEPETAARVLSRSLMRIIDEQVGHLRGAVAAADAISDALFDVAEQNGAVYSTNRGLRWALEEATAAVDELSKDCTRRTGWRWSRRAGRCRRRPSLAGHRPRGYPGRALAERSLGPSLVGGLSFRAPPCRALAPGAFWAGTQRLPTPGRLARGGLFLIDRTWNKRRSRPGPRSRPTWCTSPACAVCGVSPRRRQRARSRSDRLARRGAAARLRV
jgi:hypothetical protein